jgi:hypothetical protein
VAIIFISEGTGGNCEVEEIQFGRVRGVQADDYGAKNSGANPREATRIGLALSRECWRRHRHVCKMSLQQAMLVLSPSAIHGEAGRYGITIRDTVIMEKTAMTYREAMLATVKLYEGKTSDNVSQRQWYERVLRSAKEILANMKPAIADKNLNDLCGMYHYERGPADVYVCEKALVDHGNEHVGTCACWSGKGGEGREPGGQNIINDFWVIAENTFVRLAIENALEKL